MFFYSLSWSQFELSHVKYGKGLFPMKNMSDTEQEIIKLAKYSPRRQSKFDKFKEEIAPGCPGVCE